ncbi:MAG: glycine cleavage system aminomethyltransferase GcvT [Nitrososphaeria archaeon]
MPTELMRTHLYHFHKKYGKLTEFAGFEHALWYDGIATEHIAVRDSVGVFDVTHMGRTLIEGPGSVELLERLLPRRISKMNLKQGRYAFFLNKDGGIVDDLTVFRLNERKFLVVYNSGNRAKDFAWMKRNSEGLDVSIKDISDEVVMLAVQGPKALSTLQKLSNSDLASIRRYWCDWIKLGDFDNILVSRSGYTGEDGFEVYLWDTPLDMSEKAERLLESILEAGQQFGIKPCGLGARDTLRLEAGMCLYGQDIDEHTSPLEAGLGMLIDFDKQNFIGREALVEQKTLGIKRSRVCLRSEGKGIPRSGFEVYFDGQKVGALTSGTFSPILKTGIGMGYVDTRYSGAGTELYVRIRENMAKCKVVEPPFYDTTRYGYKRVV